MQADLAELGVVIVGLNDANEASGNDGITDGRDLAWLQDTAEDGVWDAWSAEWRDLYLLDRNNQIQALYNLTDVDLADPDNYALIKADLEAMVAEE